MLGIIVKFFSTKTSRSQWAYRIAIKLLKLRCKIQSRKFEFDDVRFREAAWTSVGNDPEYGNELFKIELVVVSTLKDFDILRSCVDYALNAMSQFQFGGIRIIVPPQDIDSCAILFKDFKKQIQIVNELDLVSQIQVNKISKIFGTRNTWILQQLLKVKAVLTTKSDAVLIIDSDTILLNKRSWFNKSNQQILMPTYEFNSSYYKFLNKLGISAIEPHYTYIAHHMIMQPKILLKILDQLKFKTFDDFVDYCCNNADTSTNSAICIEYELYAQYLYNYLHRYFYHAVWANVSFPRIKAYKYISSPIRMKILSLFYNSISFHSWS
jgi:hypothetical protein